MTETLITTTNTGRIIECPVDYEDPETITEDDIVHDPAITGIREDRWSVNEILAGDLPDDVTHIWWSDTGSVECVAHFATEGWRQTVTPSDEVTGIAVRSTTLRCDACAEADRS